MAEPTAVVKIGGSILRGDAGYAAAAASIARQLARHPRERLVVVVSAEYGATDALLAEARTIVAEPDPSALDLLWSTGELRSVALLVLSLQRLGIAAAAANVPQTGLRLGPAGAAPNPLRLRALLARHRVVVAPGFLARADGDRIATLGRGGSDLTAVLIAAGLQAARCDLVKDVPGYFTADPHVVADARLVAALDYERALSMADDGCELVQREALAAARDADLPLVVRSLDAESGTLVQRGAADAQRSVA